MKERYQKIGDTKRFTTNEILCDGYPRQLLTYMRTVRQMEFAQEPDVCIDFQAKTFSMKSHDVYSTMVYDDCFTMLLVRIISLMMAISIGSSVCKSIDSIVVKHKRQPS